MALQLKKTLEEYSESVNILENMEVSGAG